MVSLSRAHRTLLEAGAYPLVAGTVLAMAVYLVRVVVTHTTTYGFLTWNLFLAWIPYGCALACSLMSPLRSGMERWTRRLLAGVWLGFFPNAPYLLTDIVHFRRHTEVPWWYDLAMLLLFAGVGLQLALASLRRMHRLVEGLYGTRAGWYFVAAAAGLSGLGVYIGRFLRWNSWDVVTNPHGLAADLYHQAGNPEAYLTAVGVTGLFGALLLWSYLVARHPAR